MFAIVIRLNEFDLGGLEALEWRRAHGLPDGNSVTTHVYHPAQHHQTVVVDEVFARKWFPRNRADQSIYLNAQLLKVGEIMISPRDENLLVPCLSDEVAKDIYVQQRTRELAWQALPLWKTLWYILTNRSPA